MPRSRELPEEREPRHGVTREAGGGEEAQGTLGEADPPPRPRNGRTTGRTTRKAPPPLVPDPPLMPEPPPLPDPPPVPDPPLVSTAPAALPGPPEPSEPSPGPSGPPALPDSPLPPAAGAPDEAAPAPNGRRRVVLLVAAAAGVLFAGAAAVLLAGPDGRMDGNAKEPRPGPAPTTGPTLPEGVRCTGQECAGQDPETMGCGGAYARTTASATVGGAYVEVRYSEVCGAAWARITEAGPGDRLRVTAPVPGGGAARTESGEANADGEAYTRMVEVGSAAGAPARARACATLTTGQRGCTAAEAGRAAAP
ncbi:DUF2690 domain-containing protein [Streptomyces sparsogenes]|uniref:DUF2690 domain-containing protein n=1 Tax=Streptomyces sparsogenes TaxID=67365 RepID=UPI0033F864FD